MKKKTIVAVALILALLSGCAKDNDSTASSEQSSSETAPETVVETVAETTESIQTQAPAETTVMTLAEVDTDAWKMTAGKKKDHQQKLKFETNDNEFSVRVLYPESKAKKVPAVIIFNYEDPVSGVHYELYEGCIEALASEGMACFFIEPFGVGETVGGCACPTPDNINEMITVLLANMDKIHGIDSSKIVLWSNSRLELFTLNAMQDKSDKVSAIFLPGTSFLKDGAYIRELIPDKKEASADWYIDGMYDVDAEVLFKKIKTKVYIYTPLICDPDEEELCEKYCSYFSDKVLERAGMVSDLNKVDRGEGEIFEKAVEDLKTLFEK